MEGGATTYEKDCGALGGLFQTIINDMRGSSPIWEDFASKALKLHTSLKTTVVAIGAFLEAFQKVADMATGSKGATKEIGSALTRLCLRHRSIEAHLKVFSSSIVDNLVAPLQDKLEDWKKAVAQIDKDHAKEHKKARQEIKKAASDTMRLQKKVKKGGSQHGHHKSSEMQAKLDVSMQEVNAKYNVLEDTMKSSVRTALIEERSRFCHFITCLKPFVDGEMKLLTEISNISEIMQSLCLQASEPSVLPPSSEQVILDLKGLDNSAWNLQQHPSPPSSPSSLGSRKSSMCSINSINSSSSGSSKSHSPSHTMHKRTVSQPHHLHHHHHHHHQAPGTIRLTSVSSQDSGFTSQDTLFHRPQTPPQSLNLWQSSSNNPESRQGDVADCDSTPTTPSDNTPSASSTWNNWPNPPGGSNKADPSRPHTISSAYEKGHGRPALKPDMFEPPAGGVEMRPKPSGSSSSSRQERLHSVSSTGSVSSISSVGSGSTTSSHHRTSATISKMQPVLPPHSAKAKVKAVAPPMLPQGIHQQPIYANTKITQQSPDDGEPTTPTTPAGMTQAFPAFSQSPSAEVTLSALDKAMEQMVGIAGIPEEEEMGDDSQDVVTPRASTSSSSDGTPGRGRGSSTSSMMMSEQLVDIHKPKIQADTSLELAKAIRELEASTAALTSVYDTQQDPHPAPTTNNPSNGGGLGDNDSYTSSKSSLPCSSGYGTMTSTPAGSEDTIASGGPQHLGVGSRPEEAPPLEEEDEEAIEGEEEEEDGEDCTVLSQSDPFDQPDKSCTLPRTHGDQGKGKGLVMGKGGKSTATTTTTTTTTTQPGYKPPINPKRPASTTAIPSSSNLSRRSSSSSTSKPPPPVRRTASVKSAVLPASATKARQSPQRQMSEGGQPVEDGPYAELQLIQNKIQQQQLQQMSGQAGHGGPEMPPPGHSHPTAVLQSLNAKFASLNNQYRDGGNSGPGIAAGNMAHPQHYQQQQQTSGPNNGLMGPPPPVQPKSANGPPTVKQKPKLSVVPPPPSVTMNVNTNVNTNDPHNQHQHLHQQQQQQQQQQLIQQHLLQQQQQIQQQLNAINNSSNNYNYQGNQGVAQPQQQQIQPHHQQQQLHQQQQHPYYQQQQQQQHPYQPSHPHPQSHPGEEDLPLPPTPQELQEMERIYSCPQAPHPNNPQHSVAAALPGNKPPQLTSSHQTQPPSNTRQPQGTPMPMPADGQISLMQELKRRVSVDTNSSSDA